MALTKKHLLRRAEIHRVFAEELQSHFRRLWGRELAQEEVATLRSVTLCDSLMGLEMWERRLIATTTQEEATLRYSEMLAMVAKHGPGVIAQVKGELATSASSLPDSGAFPDLLAWEEALVDRLSWWRQLLSR
jgi:hypothetical protein